MSETNAVAVPEVVKLEPIDFNDLPEQCKPSLARWIVTQEKSYYPVVMFFREEVEAYQWAGYLSSQVNPEDNHERVRAITVAEIKQQVVMPGYDIADE